MSKNVIITEGSTGRRMPDVSKVLTVRPTSGSDLWVPVDERLSRQKYITKNGTFYATDEELYAFSKVTVNVPGGVQGVTTPTVTTPISNTSPDVTADINPITGQLNDVSVSIEQPNTSVNPTAIPQAMGVSGNSIVGVDPDTGNYYVVGVSPEGEITKDQMPVCIAIEVPPNKLIYDTTDEVIDYSGMVVRAYTRFDTSGNVTQDSMEYWNYGKYRDGRIPTEELILHSTVSEAIEGNSVTLLTESNALASYYGTSPVPLYKAYTRGAFTQPAYINQLAGQATGNSRMLIGRNDWYGLGVLIASDNSEDIYQKITTNTEQGTSSISDVSLSKTYTKNGKTVYWNGEGFNASNFSYGGPFTPEVNGTGLPTNYLDNGDVAWEVAYASCRATSQVQVQWTCPYNNVTYSTGFTIEIRQYADGSQQGQQSGNDGYSGSGGGSF